MFVHTIIEKRNKSVNNHNRLKFKPVNTISREKN